MENTPFLSAIRAIKSGKTPVIPPDVAVGSAAEAVASGVDMYEIWVDKINVSASRITYRALRALAEMDTGLPSPEELEAAERAGIPTIVRSESRPEGVLISPRDEGKSEPLSVCREGLRLLKVEGGGYRKTPQIMEEMGVEVVFLTLGMGRAQAVLGGNFDNRELLAELSGRARPETVWLE